MTLMKTGTFLDRVKHRADKWRASGSTAVDYEDVKALIACADALRKHEPDNRALKWLDSGTVIID